jgi:hypothetical protein
MFPSKRRYQGSELQGSSDWHLVVCGEVMFGQPRPDYAENGVLGGQRVLKGATNASGLRPVVFSRRLIVILG